MNTLNIELEQLADHQVKLVVEFEQEIMEQYKRRAARKIAEKSKIPGFRPGKAPYDVIVRTYGEEAIKEQAVELLVDDKYGEVLDQAGVKPGAAGSLQEIVSVEPPKLIFVVPKEPEVVLGDYRAIRKPYKLEPVTEEDLEKVLLNVRNSYATTESVDRPAQQGDMVYLQLTGELDKLKEGEKEAFIDNVSYEMIVGGSETEPDTWPFEGFSQNLAGMSKNEEKVIEHKYAKDHPDEILQGKKVKFTIKVEEVKALKVPALDEDFARLLGNFDSVEALREQVREQAEHQRMHEYDDAYFDELIEKLVSESEIKYPPQVLEEETRDLVKNFEENLGRQKMDLDAYLKMRELTREDFIEQEVKPAAVKRLSRSLVLSEVASAEKIQVDQKELQNIVSLQMDSLLRSPGFEKVKGQQAMQQLASAVMMDSANRLYNQKTLDRLQAIASGEAEAEGQEPEPVESGEGKKKSPKSKASPTKSAAAKKTVKKAAAETPDNE
jgi:trigger factor